MARGSLASKHYLFVAEVNCERPEEITALAQRLAPCYEKENWCWSPRYPPQAKRIEEMIWELVRTVMFRPAGEASLMGGLKVTRSAMPNHKNVVVGLHKDLFKHLTPAAAPAIRGDQDGYPGITLIE